MVRQHRRTLGRAAVISAIVVALLSAVGIQRTEARDPQIMRISVSKEKICEKGPWGFRQECETAYRIRALVYIGHGGGQAELRTMFRGHDGYCHTSETLAGLSTSRDRVWLSGLWFPPHAFSGGKKSVQISVVPGEFIEQASFTARAPIRFHFHGSGQHGGVRC